MPIVRYPACESERVNRRRGKTIIVILVFVFGRVECRNKEGNAHSGGATGGAPGSHAAQLWSRHNSSYRRLWANVT